MKLSIRAAVADDKHGIWQLYEGALKPHIGAIWGWDEAWQLADFDKTFSASSTSVVEVDGEFAGYVQLDLGTSENYLRMLILSARFRSLGIGAALLTQIRHKRRNLSLRVFRTNDAARRFYEREGWLVVADEGDFVRMKYQPTTAPPGSDPASGQIEQ